ncbi:hypothetical protein Q1695_013991 [Nippostrongylus brasiliensis]|nr:hypothetical protein Q1695_013991 [Nippostrongylus brasiliensis]
MRRPRRNAALSIAVQLVFGGYLYLLYRSDDKSIAMDLINKSWKPPETGHRFVALASCKTRLGNQMYRLLSGYGMARRLNRKLFFLINPSHLHVLRYYSKMDLAFPKLANDNILKRSSSLSGLPRVKGSEHLPFDVISAEVEYTVVPNAQSDEGRQLCYHYDDPLTYADHPAKFLVLNQIYAQNVRYFQDYLPEIRSLLEFSPLLRRRGERILKQLGSYITNSMCIHIRQGDYATAMESSLNSTSTISAIRLLASRHNLSRYFLFGDDQSYMKGLASELTNIDEGKAAAYSVYDELEDFYLASRLCNTFLIARAVSTFGWWLAFFVQNQNAVYYMYDSDDKLQIPEFFLPTWKQLFDWEINATSSENFSGRSDNLVSNLTQLFH